MAKLTTDNLVAHVLAAAQLTIDKTRDELLEDPFINACNVAELSAAAHCAEFSASAMRALQFDFRHLRMMSFFPEGKRCEYTTIGLETASEVMFCREHCNLRYDTYEISDCWYNPATDMNILMVYEEECGCYSIWTMKPQYDLFSMLKADNETLNSTILCQRLSMN